MITRSHAWLGLGANIGDPVAQLHAALERLAEHDHLEIIATSSMIVTPPWGKTDQPDFHNMVVEIATDLPALELLNTLLAIEIDLGRVREEIWGPRVIDIDIIAYDRQIITSDRLTLPHKHAHERAFVLDPLREIAPAMADWIVSFGSASETSA